MMRRRAAEVALVAVGAVVLVAGLVAWRGDGPAPTQTPPVVTARLRALGTSSAPVAQAAPSPSSEEDVVAEDPTPAMDPSGVPEELGRRELEGGMERVWPLIEACQSLEQFVGIATVELTIKNSGGVQSVTLLPPLDQTQTGECMAKAVKTASFPKFRGTLAPTINLTYQFLFRPPES
jgi:hypothetical protein